MLKDTLSRAAPFATKLVPPVSGIVRVFEGKGGQKVAKIAGIAEDDDYLLLRCWVPRFRESGRGFAGWSYCGLFFAMDVAVGGGYGAADQMLSIKFPHNAPNELLYERAGYLWACSFLNKHIGKGIIPSTHMRSIAKDMIRDGKRLANKSRCPLMYEWNSERYWGAAHGLAGIVHALMGVNLNEDDLKYVKGTLNYMINNRFISGNYPSIEGFNADWLVHWCHGAPGVALTLTKAARIRE
ncbi:lanC-like protein GCR2 [Zingiber officinale]|uniref:lanC-like protein GCR2 n=1 Tax=Zingiber officinale TaxID=94328 RepID=UPI001C4C9313|nr:lanC-like protein GCR2 [Zingiber officinale]